MLDSVQQPWSVLIRILHLRCLGWSGVKIDMEEWRNGGMVDWCCESFQEDSMTLGKKMVRILAEKELFLSTLPNSTRRLRPVRNIGINMMMTVKMQSSS